MRQKGILLAVAILLACGGLVRAEEAAEAISAPCELHGYIDMTYQSKYIWRGFDVYNDKSAIQPALNLDLWGTGFGLNIAGHRANSSGFELAERWDYTVYYHNTLCPDEPLATDYLFAYRYYNYPDMSSHTRDSFDLQEVHGLFRWPNLLPIKGLVPGYCIVKLWPSNSGTLVGGRTAPDGSFSGTASGFAHIFMLDYGVPVGCPFSEGVEQVLNLHSEVVYNDGIGPAGQNVDHDWSNAVFGVSTELEVAKNITFTPGVYHQITMDESVNDDKDETWVELSLKYLF